AVVVGASTDSYHAHKAWYESDARLRGVTYPVIADTTHELSRAFDVLLDDGAALRATFIVDPEGIVRHLQVNDLAIVRNVAEALRLVRAPQTGHLCPGSWQPGERTLSEQLFAAAD